MRVQIALALCIFLVGCKTPETVLPDPAAYASEIAKVKLLKKGMTRAEVESTLKPSESQTRSYVSGIDYEFYMLTSDSDVLLVYDSKSPYERSLEDTLLCSPMTVSVLVSERGKQRWVEIPLVQPAGK